MRCIGASNPPCVRCLKGKRECRVQLPNRQQRRLSSSRSNPLAHTLAPSSPNPPTQHIPSPGISHASASPTGPTAAGSQLRDSSSGLASECRNLPLDQPSFPSIFSSSPITIASTKGSKSHGSSGDVPASRPQIDLDMLSHGTILDLVEL